MFNKFKNVIYNSFSSLDDEVAASTANSLMNEAENEEASSGDSVEPISDRKNKQSKQTGTKMSRSISFREDLLVEMRNIRRLKIAHTKEDSSNNTNNNNSIYKRVFQFINNSEGNSSSSDYNDSYSKISDRNARKTIRPMPKCYTYAEEIERANLVNDNMKFKYSRPEFLALKSDEEIFVSTDHHVRPILLLRDITRLPWLSGYAECVNAGKSPRNEDQALSYQGVLPCDPLLYFNKDEPLDISNQLPWTLFGVFDGHAGSATAVTVSKTLHTIIENKLSQIASILLALEFPDLPKREPVKCDSSLSKNDFETDTFDDALDSNPNESKLEKVNEVFSHVNLSTIMSHGQYIDNHQESLSEQPIPEDEQESLDNRTDQIENDKDKGCNEDTNKNSPLSTTITKQQIASECDNMNSKNRSNSCTKESLSYHYSLDDVKKKLDVDSLIVGALESAFWEMDELIGKDKLRYKMPGGCTAIVSLFILGKLYVCNAGDSRAIVCREKKVIPMSSDFTPVSEKDRILRIGLHNAEFLGDDFTHLEFMQRPKFHDVGSKMLYRNAYMTGWSFKTITQDDLKFPLVFGEGKRSRVLATIGVTRGFGDHEIRSIHGSLPIKPFLTPEPGVKKLEIEKTTTNWTDDDVLIMGTDGLWDVTSNQGAAEIVQKSFESFSDKQSKYRYISAAQDLVMQARGYPTSNDWRTSNGRPASYDDITVFVIPLKHYMEEYSEWKRLRLNYMSDPSNYATTSQTSPS